MRTRSRLSFALFAVLSLAGSGLVGACSDQGEGEPCSPFSTDCQSNLQCTLVAGNEIGYRCCPIPPAQPSANNICSPNNPGVGNPPPDGGPGGEGDAEGAPEDTGAGEGSSPAPDAAEAAVDAASDALGDAPNEGAAEAAIESGPADAADGATE
jgi:hypothetical protein